MYGYIQKHIGAFGPHEIRTLVAALDNAWESIQASGTEFDTAAHAESARAILAKHIIEAAKQGECDQGRLRDGALVAWAQSKLRSAPRRSAGTSNGEIQTNTLRRKKRWAARPPAATPHEM
jgi:hypothetical protein